MNIPKPKPARPVPFIARTLRFNHQVMLNGRLLGCPERMFVAVDRNGATLFTERYCPQ